MQALVFTQNYFKIFIPLKQKILVPVLFIKIKKKFPHARFHILLDILMLKAENQTGCTESGLTGYPVSILTVHPASRYPA
jgi:hypothetical protein